MDRAQERHVQTTLAFALKKERTDHIRNTETDCGCRGLLQICEMENGGAI